MTVVMLGYLLFVINVLFVIVNTMVCSILICLLALIKIMLPRSSRQTITPLANRVMWWWATLNHKTLNLFNKIEWDVQGGEGLSKQGWYLVISNHLSWTDIVIICSVLKDKIPMPKFFLKQALFYIPFWA